MTNSTVFFEEYAVGLNDVDFRRRLKLSALFNYFQDIANLAAEALGVGMERVEQEFGVAWILTKVRVDLTRQPDWDEVLTIETWPQAPGKIDFERDYLVKDREGQVVAAAVSQWVIMDIGQRKLRRASHIPLVLPEVRSARAIDGQWGKLQPAGDLEVAYQRVIGYSDIDVNGHLNNCKYIDFIMDCLPMEVHRDHRVTRIEVNFVHEALPGDTVALYREAIPANHDLRYIEGVNTDSGEVVFRAQLELQPASR